MAGHALESLPTAGHAVEIPPTAGQAAAVEIPPPTAALEIPPTAGHPLAVDHDNAAAPDDTGDPCCCNSKQLGKP